MASGEGIGTGADFAAPLTRYRSDIAQTGRKGFIAARTTTADRAAEKDKAVQTIAVRTRASGVKAATKPGAEAIAPTAEAAHKDRLRADSLELTTAVTSPIRRVDEVPEDEFSETVRQKVNGLEPEKTVVVKKGSTVFIADDESGTRITDRQTDGANPGITNRDLVLYQYDLTADSPALEKALIASSQESAKLGSYDGIVFTVSDGDSSKDSPVRIAVFDREQHEGTQIVKVVEHQQKPVETDEIAELKKQNVTHALVASLHPLASALQEDIQGKSFTHDIHDLNTIVASEFGKGLTRAPLRKAVAEDFLMDLGLLAEPNSGENDKIELVFDKNQTAIDIQNEFNPKRGMLIETEIEARRTVIGYRWKTDEAPIEFDDINALDLALENVIAEADQANKALFGSNLGLVRKVANEKTSSSSSHTPSDLEQIGAIGLIKAAFEYDGTRGYDFSTYAIWRIRGEMKHNLRHEREIGMPRHLQDIRGQILHAEDTLWGDTSSNRSPITIATIAQEADLTEEEVADYLAYRQRGMFPESLYAPIDGSDAHDTYADIVPSNQTVDTTVVEHVDTVRIYQKLDERTKRLIMLVGIDGLTHAEAGKKEGISQVHTSRLLAKAIAEFGGIPMRKAVETPRKAIVNEFLSTLHQGREPNFEELDTQLATMVPSERNRRVIIEMYIGNLSNGGAARELGINKSVITGIVETVHREITNYLNNKVDHS